jgi:hypothetical protein
MADKVVYVIGAGFSAPLGLPVVGNFWEKSKELHAQGKADFGKVFKQFERLHKTSSYYESDQFNIEEILSILSMGSLVRQNDKEREDFSGYVTDVITAYSPSTVGSDSGKFAPLHTFGSYAFSGLFESMAVDKRILMGYGAFVSNVLGLAYDGVRQPTNHFVARCKGQLSDTQYTIISLNYDLILEMICEYASKHYGSKVAFKRDFQEGLIEGTYLAKLHGSVGEDIIPPTWNKAIVGDKIISAWRIARAALASANHIRFIGYSLPKTDSYIQYLFKEAILDCEFLKTIDVICLDPDSTVKARYKDFVRFGRFRFASTRTEDYMQAMHSAFNWSAEGEAIRSDQLEVRHESFMRSSNA